mgnify:CR=1 FL=1
MNNVLMYIAFILLGLMICVIAGVCLSENIKSDVPNKPTYNMGDYNKDNATEKALRQVKKFNDEHGYMYCPYCGAKMNEEREEKDNDKL